MSLRTVQLSVASVFIAVSACKPAPTSVPPPGSASASTTSGAVASHSAPVPAGPERELWAGTVAAPEGLKELSILCEKRDGTWHAQLQLPGAPAGIELSDVVVSADKLAFVLKKPGAPESTFQLFELARRGDSASGLVLAGGMEMYLKLAKLAPGETPHPLLSRPQTPKGPFPYSEREVTVDAPEKGKLAGTLTFPNGKGPFPAVLLISGSGQQDRDETIFGHKAFLLMADRLTREGFAVLRLDDRATGKTQGALNSLDTDIGDAQAAFEFLAAQPEVDAARVGLMGHSVGGAIAPIVATRSKKKAAFIVSLAGTAIPGADLVPLQLEADLTAKGAPAEIIAKAVAMQRKMGAAVVKGDKTALRKTAREVLAEQAALAGQPAPTGPELEAAVDAMLAQTTNPWTLGYFKTDPREAWRKVKSPVLMVVGEKDTQVPAKANIAAITEALGKGGNKDVTTHAIPGLNHLFQHAIRGTTDEYGMLEETFDPATLDEIAGWLVGKAQIRK